MTVDHSLGPLEGTDLRATVNANTGSGDEAGLPPDIRFPREIITLFQRRRFQLQSMECGDPDIPAVFLLKPDQGGESEKLHLEMVHMLQSGKTQLTGRLWFVNTAAVAGRYGEIISNDTEEIFQWINDELELGDIPAVVIDPNTAPTRVYFYKNGLGDPYTYLSYDLTDEDVTLERIKEIIDTIYENNLKTPDAQPSEFKLWHKELPVEHAEKRIQGILHIGLSSKLPAHKIRMESPSPVGRYDILICQNLFIPGYVIFDVVLELKVLRSKGSTGESKSERETLVHIEEGILQAVAYRVEQNAKESALCCFDMRSVDDPEQKCFEAVQQSASTNRVALWRWYLYSSAKMVRAARYRDS